MLLEIQKKLNISRFSGAIAIFLDVILEKNTFFHICAKSHVKSLVSLFSTKILSFEQAELLT